MITLNSFPGRLLMTFLVVSTLSFVSCEKSGYLPDKAGHTSGKLANTTITGMIRDISGNPMQGVIVSVGNNQAVTNVYGAYLLENVAVNNKRFVVTCNRQGFFNSVKAVAFDKQAKCHYVHLLMINRSVTGTFNSQAGGTIQISGNATIQFPPNAIADANGNPYNGTVKVYAALLNPDNANFYQAIPGGDLRAENSNGKERVLLSYGMIKAELFGQNGQPLNIASGKKAQLKLPVASTQLSQAPASIPLWHLDEETAIWQEEGTATLNGGFYEGDVAHFTWWNCDYPDDMVAIQGQVLDCIGNPVPNATVLFNNMYTLTTNSNGIYSASWPENSMLSAIVPLSMNPTIFNNSNTITAGPFATGSSNQLPDLIVPCGTSRLIGNIRGCAGNIVSALVVVTGTELPQAYYCYNGELDVQVLQSEPHNVIAYTNNYSVSTSIMSAPSGGVANLGILNACQQTKTSVVMNGDGYNNKHYEIDSTTSSTMYSVTGPTTGIIITGYTEPDNKQCLIQIDFCGSEKGNYELGPGTCNSDVSMILDGVAYYPDDINSVSDFITVIEYGNTGGKIRGSFFSHMQRANGGSGTIPITVSGNFVVTRTH